MDVLGWVTSVWALITLDAVFLTWLCGYMILGSLYNVYVCYKHMVREQEEREEADRETDVQYPIVVHGFHVTNERGRDKVLGFFEWLEKEEEREEDEDDMSSKEARFNIHDMVNFSPSQLRNLLQYLYNQQRMWERLVDGPVTPVVQDWINMLNNAAVTHFAGITETIYGVESMTLQRDVAIPYFHDLILYSKVYTHPAFAMGRSKFQATVLRACVQLCVCDGLLPALLLLGHLKPDLFSDDAYLVLNNETPFYKDLIEPADLEGYPAYKELLDTFHEYVIL